MHLLKTKVAVATLLLCTATVSFLLFDWAVFRLDGCSCSSDNLFLVKVLLELEFEKSGRIPPTKQALVDALVAWKGHNSLRCNIDDADYLYFPSAVNDGKAGVVVKCSNAVHGFHTKFSWAIVWDGVFRFAKILADGTIVHAD